MSKGNSFPCCSVSQCNASSACVLATHGARHSDANVAAIVRATAGPAQICQWTGSAEPRQNGGQGGGLAKEIPIAVFFFLRDMFKSKQINYKGKATTNLTLSYKPFREHSGRSEKF